MLVIMMMMLMNIMASSVIDSRATSRIVDFHSSVLLDPLEAFLLSLPPKRPTSKDKGVSRSCCCSVLLAIVGRCEKCLMT